MHTIWFQLYDILGEKTKTMETKKKKSVVDRDRVRYRRGLNRWSIETYWESENALYNTIAHTCHLLYICPNHMNEHQQGMLI